MKTRSVKKYLFLTLIAVLCAACVAVGCLFMGGGTPSVGATTQEHVAAFGSTHEEKGKALTEAGGKLSEGAYYLTGNITLTADITIPANATVDLSGYATTSALNAKADQTTVTELSNNLSTLDSRVDGIGITKQEIENGVKLTVNGASVDINFPEPGLICQITVNDTTGQGLNIGCTSKQRGHITSR